MLSMSKKALNLLVILLMSLSQCYCVDRILLAHHKTGTVLARKISKTLRDIAPPIITMGNGLGKMELEKDSHIVHFIRNPFSMILSAYFYHKTTEENWVHCQSNSMRYAYCPYVYDKYNTVQDSFSYIISDLNGKIFITSDGTQETLSYPDPSGHSYQSYLNSVSPKHGILIELIRANHYDLPSMISDFGTIKRRSAFGTSSKTAGDSSNVCLGSLFGIAEHNGAIYNKLPEIYAILDTIHVKQTSGVKAAIERQFGSIPDRVNAHQTNHTSTSRDSLEKLLRDFDKNSFDGLIHHYEEVLGCPLG